MSRNTLARLRRKGEKALIDAGFAPEAARQEALWLLAHATGKPLAEILAHGNRLVEEEPARRYRQWVARRAHREPFAYIVGEKEFFGLRLKVAPGVLVPRPETEMLVEAALDWLAGAKSPRVLDLCTGSGCIAIAIAHARPDVELVATDISPQALAIAADNARCHRARITFYCGDLYQALPSDAPPFSLIVANPPYMGLDELTSAPPELSFEPKKALTDFADGSAMLARVLEGAPRWLVRGGVLIVEHGARGLPPAPKGLVQVAHRKDLAGHWRMAIYCRKLI